MESGREGPDSEKKEWVGLASGSEREKGTGLTLKKWRGSI